MDYHTKVVEMYVVRCRDIDPDTGYNHTDRVLYLAFTQSDANHLVGLLAREYMDIVSDPNREFYAKKKNILF